MIDVQNPRDRSAVCAKSDACGVGGGEWGVSSEGSLLLPPVFGVPPPPPEASFPGWAKAPEDKILLCGALNQLFLRLHQGKCSPEASLAPHPTPLFPHQSPSPGPSHQDGYLTSYRL